MQQLIPKVVLGETQISAKGNGLGVGVCSNGVLTLVIFESDTLDHDRYIKKVLPVTLKYRNYIFGND